MPEIRIEGYQPVYQALCNPHLKQSLYDAGAVIMADTLLTLHGQEHTRRRHLALRVFQRDFARHYEHAVFPATVARTLGHFHGRNPLDLVAFGHSVTMNLTADFAGIDRSGEPEETARLLSLVQKFGEGATMVHSTRDPAVLTAEVQRALGEYERDFLQPSLARRQRLLAEFARGGLPEAGLPRDMLTILLRNEDRLELSPGVLSREIAFYLQAGSHSTANATVHAIDELLRWCRGFPDRRQALEADPLFLQRAVHEALRLHPASPVAWRRAVSPLTLPSGVAVTPEDLLVLDLAAANVDQTVFGSDSRRFNPYREISARRVQPFGLTFGLGVHNCLGRDLDAGLVPQVDTQPDDHQFGTVTALVRVVLCDLGAMDAPDDPPRRDKHSVRGNWQRFPVRVRYPQS